MKATDYKKAWDLFQDSIEWKNATDPISLQAPHTMRRYLENRIHRAFDAGWNAGLEQAAKHPNGPAEGSK